MSLTKYIEETKEEILTSFPPIRGTNIVGIITAVPRDSM
jgi:hypothetical protein